MPRTPALVLLAAPLTLAACSPGEASSSATGTSTPGATALPSPAAAPPSTPIASGEPRSTASLSQDASDSCGASKVRGRWLNSLPSDDVKAAIAAVVGERRIRYYTEGDAITMDYSDERLNVVLGKDGRIEEFRCG